MQIGDEVVYPMHGAGVIAAVEDCNVMGAVKQYYVLAMPLGNMKVMIPVDNVDNIGLRDVCSDATVQRVIEVFHEPPQKTAGSWNKRFHLNLDRLKTGDILEVAAVTRNLMLQDRLKRISSGERRLLDLARQIIITELVYALRMTTDEVEVWIEQQLEGNGF